MADQRRARRRPELLSQADCEALARRVIELVDEPMVDVRIGSSVYATTSFARGDTHMNKEDGEVVMQFSVRGATTGTTQIDDAGLKAAIAEAKRAAEDIQLRDAPWTLKGPISVGHRPKTFFESTSLAMDPQARAVLVNQALDATDAAGLVGAGDLELNRYAGLTMNTNGLVVYRRHTYGEFSLTARTPDGTGSGWGWSGFEDWNRVETEAVIARAVDLGRRSAHPVAVEPGRYTVILEPTATAAFLKDVNWGAFEADQGLSPFAKDPLGTNKIGLRMLDSRLSMVSDPWDPHLPEDTVTSEGDPVQRTVWFERGVLRELHYDEGYAKSKRRQPTYSALPGLLLFGEGPTQTLDEMIASTKRGIWVNRLSVGFPMNPRTHLLTGTTRDGTFLIEDGKITKAIKNFRFNESPFFVLNKLEAFGEPVRAARHIVAPRVKVRDFDFTSLTDAV